MLTRLYNCKILTMNDNEKIFDGEIWIKDDLISNVIQYNDENKKEDIEKNNKFDTSIDLSGKILLPGFKNCHTHSAMTFLRSYADDLKLEDWLFTKIFPMEAKLNGDIIYYFTRLAILEYLTSGITCDLDMYFYEKEGIKARIDSGFRGIMCGPQSNTVGESPLQTIQRSVDNYEYASKIHPLISAVYGLHSVYTCSPALLMEMSKIIHKEKKPFYTHNSETKVEIQSSIEMHEFSPTKALNHLGLYDYGGGAFHAIYTNEEDMKILKEKNVYVVTNPCSNAKLASGICPILEYRKKGIPVCIGTDGAASNNSLDFFKEMYLTAVLQKIKYDDPVGISAFEVLQMATVNGSDCLGFKNIRTLSKNQKADIVCLDLETPNMQPCHNIVSDIVYSGSKKNVYMTIIDGKILYKNNEFFVNEDVNYIYKKCHELLNKIKEN